MEQDKEKKLERIASTTDKLQLKVNDEIKSEIDIISDDEINSIIASLS